MKRLLLICLIPLALATLPHAANAGKSLPMASTSMNLKLLMADYALSNQLNYPQEFKCSRQGTTRISCTAFSDKEYERDVRRCEFTATAINRKKVTRKVRWVRGKKRVRRIVRWKPVLKLVEPSCQDIPKLWLEEPDAKATVKTEAQRRHGETAGIDFIYRTGETQFQGLITWVDRFNPARPWEPAITCEADFVVERLANQEVRATFSEGECSLA